MSKDEASIETKPAAAHPPAAAGRIPRPCPRCRISGSAAPRSGRTAPSSSPSARWISWTACPALAAKSRNTLFQSSFTGLTQNEIVSPPRGYSAQGTTVSRPASTWRRNGRKPRRRNPVPRLQRHHAEALPQVEFGIEAVVQAEVEDEVGDRALIPAMDIAAPPAGKAKLRSGPPARRLPPGTQSTSPAPLPFSRRASTKSQSDRRLR